MNSLAKLLLVRGRSSAKHMSPFVASVLRLPNEIIDVRCGIISGKHKNSAPNISQSRSVSSKVNIFDMNFDRRIKVNYQDSIVYMDSQAFKLTYDDKLVWKFYRRNIKGQFPAKNTRANCINDDGFIDTSNPCPICRDEYLVLHRDNVKLLDQFLNPYTGEIYSAKETGLCQKQHKNLTIAVLQAKDYGTITYQVAERLYNYQDYYPDLEDKCVHS